MQKRPSVQFTDEEKKLIGQAANQVWNDVAYDILTAVAEEKGKDINEVIIPRSHVIESSLDANRTEHRLESLVCHWPAERRKDLVQRVSAASYRQLINIVRPAFPATHYGM